MPYLRISLALALLCWTCSVRAEDAPPTPSTAPDYAQHIAPIFQKYCSACHNPEDADGKLNLESFAALQQGGKRGPALMPGDSANSRMLLMLKGSVKPAMPPEGNEAPTAEEVALLAAWIDAGAKGPAGAEPDRKQLLTPQIAAAENAPRAIASIACSADGQWIAVARYGEVELLNATNQQLVRNLSGLPGKVNAVSFTADSKQLVTASGVTGLYGQAAIWNVIDGSFVKEFGGHRDALYVAKLSPDGKTLATAGYDRKIILWDVATAEQRLTISVHNDAIYDAAFSPDGQTLATASGDETIKLWRVADGERLDTLSQPEAEQYTVAFSPDGKSIVGGGVDNRIRVWDFISREKPQINPLHFARFVHEGAIVRLVFSPNGKLLLSASEDRTLKLFETETYTQVHAFPSQPDLVSATDFTADGKQIVVGRMNGTLELYAVPEPAATPTAATAETPAIHAAAEDAVPMQAMVEVEPNDQIAAAQVLQLPAKVDGVIRAEGNATADSDLFRFSAKAGVPLILEINASRNKSPLDSKLEVLDAAGKKVVRVKLQAVRDSYLTFRGLDSNGRQFRLHNWEEMELNQYLYANGEVVKLWLYPRGPDSGFDMYPESGSRYTYFDTTALSHPLGEPCYIVEPLASGVEAVPNGLPVFTLYYENDDDSLRQLGSDSRLTFTAPADGEYFVRVSDVRGYQSPEHKYTLTVRPARPDFKVSIEEQNPEVSAGGGRKFGVRVERIDGFDGDVRVDISNLPGGFQATTPIVVQAGHNVAQGTILAAADAVAPEETIAKGSVVTGTATIAGQEITHPATNNLGQIKFGAAAKIAVSLLPAEGAPAGELVIHPGETIAARIRVERKDFNDRISFNPHNLPHGIIVDNIGLNGVLIPEGETERTVFITAAPWVPAQTRPFFFESQQDTKPTTAPLMLQVKGSK